MARRTQADPVEPELLFETIQHPKKRAFLQALAITCSVMRAADAAKIDRSLHYVWLKRDPEFAKQFEIAEAQGAKALEAEAIRRANEGWEEPVFHGGKVVGKIRRYSDTLLIFLMKGAMPEKYRERFEHSGAGGGALEIIVTKVGNKKAAE